MIKLSVVIGTYNQKEVLKRTLLSLFNQTLPPDSYEILLVDSSSSDGTEQMVRQFSPKCRFNYLRVENKGKASARNIGINNSQGEIIFLTDADMEATPHLLEEHLGAQEKREQAAFEGLTINPDGKPYIRSRLKPDQKLAFSYFLTGNLSIKKKAIVAAGLFDENFIGYGWEDIELGYRLQKMRVHLYYLPSAVNYHDHPVSNQGMMERKFEMGKSAALFYKKHPDFGVRLFIGINPVAMGIFHFLKKHPSLIENIKKLARFSRFFKYLAEEYQYRLGLEEGLSNS